MKRIGKIVTAVGVGIMFFGGMCDADGIYYYYLIAVIALGALVSLAGLAIMSVELSRAERRKACVYFFAMDRPISSMSGSKAMRKRIFFLLYLQ